MAGDIENDPSTAALDLDNSEAYDSAEDEDFQLEEAGGAGEDSGLSSSEDEDETGARNDRPTKRRKVDRAKEKKKPDEVDQMELDSGDEITIQKAKNKKKKRKGKGKGQANEEDDDDDVMFDEDEEGGEGGFVKTRSMRMKIQEDLKPLAKIDGATIDVDSLWAQMNAPDSELGLLPTSKPTTTEVDKEEEPATDQDKENIIITAENQEKLPSEDLIKIKRTYKFAGEMHTEEKLVPRDSAEAKLYIAETNGEKAEETPSDGNNAVKFRRPLRKLSRFDPNPSGVIKKSWEKQAITGDQDAKGPKLNTVEKSRLDWAQYVDEEGIKDELNVHSKAKEGYLGRMDFLDRVDAKREEERRNIRLRGL